MIDKSAWLKRAKELTEPTARPSASECISFATSMLSAFYGAESPQIKEFRAGMDRIKEVAVDPPNMQFFLLPHAQGVIKNTAAEIEGGLIERLRVVVAGEMLSELIRLAKEIMEEKTDAAKNVAAVLVAAAYEGLIRKMGEEFAGVTDRRKLEEVIGAVKTAAVLQGASVTTAQSYLKFRNDSLHADWAKIERAVVHSCLSFSENLLHRHFSG